MMNIQKKEIGVNGNYHIVVAGEKVARGLKFGRFPVSFGPPALRHWVGPGQVLDIAGEDLQKRLFLALRTLFLSPKSSF